MMDAPKPPPDKAEEPSVFVSKESVNQECKPGDTLSFTVKDVDPETGDLELVFEAGQSEDKPNYEQAMDKAIPEGA